MTRKKQSKWQRVLDSLHLSHLSRAGAAAAFGVVLISGTVAAVSLWPQPSVTQTSSKLTPSGTRIVGYDAQNCMYFADLDGSNPASTSEKVYYEVHKDYTLTDAQIQDGIRGLCEENVSNNTVSGMIKQLPKNLPGMLSTEAYVITAISDKSISLSLDARYTDRIARDMTITSFAKNLLIQNQDAKANYKDLGVGDTVKMIVQDRSGKSSETPENYNPFAHPENLTLLGILEMPALTGDPNVMYHAFATDIVRLEPCTESQTGFCRAYDFSR